MESERIVDLDPAKLDGIANVVAEVRCNHPGDRHLLKYGVSRIPELASYDEERSARCRHSQGHGRHERIAIVCQHFRRREGVEGWVGKDQVWQPTASQDVLFGVGRGIERKIFSRPHLTQESLIRIESPGGDTLYPERQLRPLGKLAQGNRDRIGGSVWPIKVSEARLIEMCAFPPIAAQATEGVESPSPHIDRVRGVS
jgi:hypothetical protein